MSEFNPRGQVVDDLSEEFRDSINSTLEKHGSISPAEISIAHGIALSAFNRTMRDQR